MANRLSRRMEKSMRIKRIRRERSERAKLRVGHPMRQLLALAAVPLLLAFGAFGYAFRSDDRMVAYEPGLSSQFAGERLPGISPAADFASARQDSGAFLERTLLITSGQPQLPSFVVNGADCVLPGGAAVQVFFVPEGVSNLPLDGVVIYSDGVRVVQAPRI